MTRIARGLLYCVAGSLAMLPSFAQPLQLDLTDPASGAEVRVESGARALHVVFLAAWCSSCIDELESLSELEARWNGQGYRLVVIAVATRHSRERLVRFSDDYPLPGEFLFDAQGRVGASLRAAHLPTHIVFDATGGEVFRSSSLKNGIADAVHDLLAAPFEEGAP